jgi:tape measure domain-containing protein
MAESYSVKAQLSAVDSGFSSTLKRALGVVDGFGSKLSGISFGFLSGVGQQVFSSLTSGISGLVSEIDSSNASWQTFESNLSMIDWDKGAISEAKKSMQDFAQKTVYSSSDMATTFAQLAAVGVKDTGNLVQAFGGLAAAAENPQQAMKTLSQQATQMAAKPSVAWQDFKLMLEQTPAGIAAVAREMGMSTSELVTAVQDGKVKTEDFFNAIKKAGGEGSELAELATKAKTIGQAMDGLKETLGNKLTPAFAYLSEIGIGAVEGISDALAGIDGEAIKETVAGWVKDAIPLWNSFKNAAGKVFGVISGLAKKLAPVFSALKKTMGGALKSAFDQIGKINVDAVVSKISGAIQKAKPYWDAFKSVVLAVAGAIQKVLPYIAKVGSAIGNFFLNNSSAISKLIPYIAGAIGAFKGFNLVKSIFGRASSAASGATTAIGNGFSKVSQIINSVGEMFKDIGSGISDVFRGIGTGIKSVFTGIGKALQMANPANILALGAAVAIAAAGFALLATQGEGVATILGGIGGVVESVGAALSGIISAAITAIAEALVILAPVMPIIAASLVMLTPLVIAFGQAFSLVAVAIGEAISKIVVAIGKCIAIVVEALTPIVEIIGNTIAKIAQILVDGIVQITEALAPLVPVFMEAFTKITEIVSNAIVTIVETLAPYIPEITKMVEATSEAIQAICSAFSTLVEQIAPIIDSVTQLVQQLGDSLTEILGGASELVTSFGDSISQVIDSIGGAISGVIDSVGGVFESMGEAALNAGKGFEHLANGVKTITKLNLLDMAASMGAVSLELGSLVKKADGLDRAGKGMSDLASGLNKISSSGAKDLSSIGEAAESAVETMTSAFEEGAKVAQECGKLAGTGFAESLQTGLALAPTVAQSTVVIVNTTLLTAVAGAMSAGAYIGQGLAKGMLSQIGPVRSAATQLAAAAEKAIRLAAQIHSPSRVAMGLGEYYGEGYAIGISKMTKDAWNAAKNLVSVPQLATPNFAMAYGGELAADYSYSTNHEYTIVVPVEIDGREAARATATYMQNELDKRQKRESRKQGKV